MFELLKSILLGIISPWLAKELSQDEFVENVIEKEYKYIHTYNITNVQDFHRFIREKAKE